MHEHEHGELALRGEGGLRFVEEEEAVFAHAGFEQGEEAFAVRQAVEAAAAQGKGFGTSGCAACAEFVHGVRQVEEAFGAEKEAVAGANGEAEFESTGESGRVGLLAFLLKAEVAAATEAAEAVVRGDGFQQGGLAGAVFAGEEADAVAEGDGVH